MVAHGGEPLEQPLVDALQIDGLPRLELLQKAYDLLRQAQALRYGAAAYALEAREQSQGGSA